MPRVLRALVLCVALSAAGGCRPLQSPATGRSPLAPLKAPDEAIALEVFTAPAGLSEEQLANLWNSVDEQPLPAELRQRLADNGLRAGIAGPSVPDALADLLKVTDERIEAEARSQVPIQPEEGVVLTVMQPRSGERRDVVTSGVHDQIVLLRREEDRAVGRTLRKAEGRFVLRAYNEADARVRVELTPELHHGEFKNRYTGGDGMMTLTQQRQTESYEELKTTATLAPGQMLIVGGRPQRPGSVGHWLLAQPGASTSGSKLYVIRAARAAPDRSFYEPAESRDAVASDLRQ